MKNFQILSIRFICFLAGIIFLAVSITAAKNLWLIIAIPLLIFGIGIDRFLVNLIRRKRYILPVSMQNLQPGQMKIRMKEIDFAPEELSKQTPFTAYILRCMPGLDRPDYWLAELEEPLAWNNDGKTIEITHIVLGARLQGECITRGAKDLWVGIAFVVNQSLLNDTKLDFNKAAYVAIGAMDDITSENK